MGSPFASLLHPFLTRGDRVARMLLRSCNPLDRVAEGGIPRMGKAGLELARWLFVTAPLNRENEESPPLKRVDRKGRRGLSNAVANRREVGVTGDSFFCEVANSAATSAGCFATGN